MTQQEIFYGQGFWELNTNTAGRDAFVTKFNSAGTKQFTKLLGITSNYLGFSIANAGGKLYLATPTAAFLRIDSLTGVIEKSLSSIASGKSLGFFNNIVYVSCLYGGGITQLMKFDIDGNLIKVETLSGNIPGIALRNGILVGTGYVFSGADANYTLDLFNP